MQSSSAAPILQWSPDKKHTDPERCHDITSLTHMLRQRNAFQVDLHLPRLHQQQKDIGAR
jgi:hypothetical protein